MLNEIEVITAQKEQKNDQVPSVYIPSEGMRRFVIALLSEECRGNKVKAEKVSGVSRNQFYYYFKEPAFQKWFSSQCDEALKTHEPIAAAALLKRVKKGDAAALKLYYELLGKVKGCASMAIAIQNNITSEGDRPLSKLTDDQLYILCAEMDLLDTLSNKDVKDEDISLDGIRLLFDIVDVRPELVRKILDGVIKPPARTTLDMNPNYPAFFKEPFWKGHLGVGSRCLTAEELQSLNDKTTT